jgi:hypothetical protein
MRAAFVGLILVALAAGSSDAQPQGERLRGIVTTLAGLELALTTRDGRNLKVTLAADYSVMEVAPFDPKAIAPGHFVGIGARPGPGGRLSAVQVVVFPESMRGTGEGHRAWDVVPEGTMTNAAVAAAVAASDGRSVTLTLPDRSVEITIGAGVTPVTFYPAERELLKVGANVILTATKAADGALRAARILVGKDGFVPPI